MCWSLLQWSYDRKTNVYCDKVSRDSRQRSSEHSHLPGVGVVISSCTPTIPHQCVWGRGKNGSPRYGVKVFLQTTREIHKTVATLLITNAEYSCFSMLSRRAALITSIVIALVPTTSAFVYKPTLQLESPAQQWLEQNTDDNPVAAL